MTVLMFVWIVICVAVVGFFVTAILFITDSHNDIEVEVEDESLPEDTQ